ncbi:hypothetical protein [Boudabousia marimammalium]|uniref:Uncharacterized protein n=1 Tax=Boudabousia marimammalium TaxID=156892 RepID=A0A1Q5PP51_9ACTO|nr:hypothetical protein [Boudabousia marimammalium]OKL49289.1 hypothetical protein BM477_04720 [Boudabousia marimammalium]
MSSTLPELISGVGMFLSAVAVVLSNRAANNSNKAVNQLGTVTASIEPNHGSSVKDSLNRIEDMQRAQGHQIGEIRRDLANHISSQGGINEDHAARLRKAGM